MNWTLEVTNNLISSLICVVSIILSISIYKLKPIKLTKSVFFFTLTNLAHSVLGIFQYLFLSKTLFIIQGFVIFLSGYLIALLNNYLKQNSYNAKFISIYTLVCGMTIVTLLDPSNIIVTTLSTGEPTLKATGSLQLIGSILALITMALFSYNNLQLFRYSKNEAKQTARLSLLGGFFYFVGFVLYVLNLTAKIPASLPLSLSIGILCILVAFKQEPKLINVLVEKKQAEDIKLIKNIIPICSFCKNIRDIDGKWYPIEKIFQEDSERKLSHGVCPKCVEIHYKDIN